MRTPCCHSFLTFILKFLNFLQTFIGISIIIYSAYLLNQWNKRSLSPLPSASSPFHLYALLLNFDSEVKVSDTPLNLAAGVFSNIGDGLNLYSHELPAPWFIYAFMRMGVVLCCIACIGHIAAESVDGCSLCFYTLLTAVLILLEGALVAFIAIDCHWEKDLPFDPTEDLHSFVVSLKPMLMFLSGLASL